MTTQRMHKTLALSLLASLAFAASAHAQSADALIHKLVEKGILSQEEAATLKAESATNANKTAAERLEIAPWIQKFKFYGDFRGRFEENNSDSSNYTERDRFRYRVRVGFTLTMLENFDVGLRLASGNPATTASGTLVGGLPITANTDLSSLESRKFFWVDAAFGR